MPCQFLDHSQAEDGTLDGMVQHMETDQTRVEVAIIGSRALPYAFRFWHSITKCYHLDVWRRLSSAPSPGRAMALTRRLLASAAPKTTVLVRILVGWVFLAEGIQKFLFPESLGVGRFAKIGIPAPAFTAPFVGTVEIFFVSLIIFGFLTRLTAIPLLIDISVAIATTKILMLIDKGLWPAAHEARTDLSMLLGLLFLLIEGAGPVSLDWYLSRGLTSRTGESGSSKRIAHEPSS